MSDYKPMPCSKELEKKILSWFFMAGDMVNEIEQAITLLYDIDFYFIENRLLFKAIKKVFKDNKGIDSTLIAPILNKYFKNNGVDNTEAYMFISDIEIAGTSFGGADIKTLIKNLKQYTLKRTIIETTHKMFNDIYNEDTDIYKIVDDGLSFYKKLSIYLNDMLDRAIMLNDVSVVRMPKGIQSGFITHDWNDSGLKPGCVTLLLGSRGHGKTTVARQMIVAVSAQKKKVFYFSGEEQKGLEKNNIARIFADEDELLTEKNDAGRTIYYPSEKAIERVDKSIGKYINIKDTSDYPEGNIWQHMYKEMITEAQKETYLFVIDNMMIINESQGRLKFDEQKQIMKQLKDFAKEYKVHVLILAHPKKGQGDQTTSGVADQENLVDTIIRYKRLDRDDGASAKILEKCDLPNEAKKRITACLLVEKVRDNGRYETSWFAWEHIKGIIMEYSTLPKAQEYHRRGFFVIPVHKYDNNDNPQQ